LLGKGGLWAGLSTAAIGGEGKTMAIGKRFYLSAGIHGDYFAVVLIYRVLSHFGYLGKIGSVTSNVVMSLV
jgi:hypothetical protein